MQSRAVRVTVVITLLLAGAAGGYAASALQRQSDDALAAQQDASAHLHQIMAAAVDLGAAQAALVAPGQAREPWFERISQMAQQLSAATASLRPRLRSGDADRFYQDIQDGVAALGVLDRRVRANLEAGQELPSANLIFGDIRSETTALVSTLQALEATERTAGVNARTALVSQFWTVVATATGVWIVGLLLLAARPRPAEAAHQMAASPATVATEVALADAQPAERNGRPAVDLLAAADVCTAISRATSSEHLPDVLARAAVVLDASGIIVWMGAGEELFAVTAHGYSRAMLTRLGAISRHANNATADAWRTGSVMIVAHDATANGAVVAPMFGVADCIGVLAAEVRHGREEDMSTRAVTAMFAAQLATVVAAWPAPSTVPQAAAEPQGQPVEAASM